MTSPSSRKLHAVPGTGETTASRGGDDEEQHLVEQAQAGDRGAWDRLYHAHYDAVLARLQALTGNVSVSEELAQDAFFQALVKLDRFDGRVPLRTWLRAVALNIVRNHWRSQRTQASAYAALAVVQDVSASAEAAGPERVMLRRQRTKALYQALARIPESLREVFVLRMIEGLDRRAAAAELGISPNNVSVRCIRARERLEAELRIMGWLPPEPTRGGPDA